LNHEWTRMNIARAFQPEFYSAAAVRPGGSAGCLAHAKPRRREGKRTSSVFGFRSGEPRTGVRGCGAWLMDSREDAKTRVQVACHGCFFATDEHGLSRIIARGDLNHEWTRMNIARAFQPEFYSAAPVRPGGSAGCLAHAKPRRREGKRTSSVFGFRSGEPRTGVRGCGSWLMDSREDAKTRVQVACPGRFFATDEHGLTRIIARGRFEPRMDTNEYSSCVPARDLFCRGCAARGLCRLFGSRKAAKARRETHKFGFRFSVFGQASRGRESAGAGPG
jgi:hypothetical protein